MKKALVFCGGGSKGSYQMGVWKLLNELNMTFDIITGTSIGCLNAAMYTQNEFQRCNELWDKIQIHMIMSEGFTIDAPSIKQNIKQNTDLLNFLKKYVKHKGADITPFYKLMDEYLDVKKMQESKMEFGLTTVTFPGLKPVELTVKNMRPEEVKLYILASCSCFPVFPVCKIGNTSYIDGGYYDNLPINHALHLGADDIVAIDLNFQGTHKEYMNVPFVRYIKPSWSLGSFMRFDSEVINDNRTLGYNDALKSFGLKDGFRYTFELNNKYSITSRRFILYLANTVNNMRMNKVKTHVKSINGGDIFGLLEKYTDRKLTDYDYFIRGLEISAEFFGLNHLKIYKVEDMLQMLFETILNIDEPEDFMPFEGYKKIKNQAKQQEFIAKIDNTLLLKYFATQLFNDVEIDIEIIYNLAAANPIVFIIFSLLRNSDFLGTEENDED